MNAPTRAPRSTARWIAAPTLDPRNAFDTVSALVHSVWARIRQTASDDDIGDPGPSSGDRWSSVDWLETVATLRDGTASLRVRGQ